MNILAVAKLLGGDVIARDSINCPGPGHSVKDRSLRVTFSGQSFTVYSQAGDDWKRCKDYVRDRLGSEPIAVPTNTADDARRTERALTIWRASLPIAGTPVATYLASRGLTYSGEALRWHPFCPFDRGYTTGCMVALVRNIITDEPQAIHRTAIDWNGRKQIIPGNNGRRALGPIKGGAVKLSGSGNTLGIGEGIETTLSIPHFQDVGVWSLLNTAGISSFPVLPHLQAVFIAIDNDRSRAGENAASIVRGRLSASNIKTYSIRTAKVGTDLNDVVMEKAGLHV